MASGSSVSPSPIAGALAGTANSTKTVVPASATIGSANVHEIMSDAATTVAHPVSFVRVGSASVHLKTRDAVIVAARPTVSAFGMSASSAHLVLPYVMTSAAHPTTSALREAAPEGNANARPVSFVAVNTAVPTASTAILANVFSEKNARLVRSAVVMSAAHQIRYATMVTALNLAVEVVRRREGVAMIAADLTPSAMVGSANHLECRKINRQVHHLTRRRLIRSTSRRLAHLKVVLALAAAIRLVRMTRSAWVARASIHKATIRVITCWSALNDFQVSVMEGA